METFEEKKKEIKSFIVTTNFQRFSSSFVHEELKFDFRVKFLDAPVRVGEETSHGERATRKSSTIILMTGYVKYAMGKTKA